MWTEATRASAEEDQTKPWHKFSRWLAENEGDEVKKTCRVRAYVPAAITVSQQMFVWCLNFFGSPLNPSLSSPFWNCVHSPHVWVTSENSDNTFEWLPHVPWIGWVTCRQMRMCQDTLRCCTTALDSNRRCVKEDEGGNMFLPKLCVLSQGRVSALHTVVGHRVQVIFTVSISVSTIDSLKRWDPKWKQSFTAWHDKKWSVIWAKPRPRWFFFFPWKLNQNVKCHVNRMFIETFVFVGAVMWFKMHGKNVFVFLFIAINLTSFYIDRRPLP